MISQCIQEAYTEHLAYFHNTQDTVPGGTEAEGQILACRQVNQHRVFHSLLLHYVLQWIRTYEKNCHGFLEADYTGFQAQHSLELWPSWPQRISISLPRPIEVASSWGW